MTGLPDDPIFDPVGIVVWAIDSGIYDVMYSAWGWPVVEIVHFTGLCLLMGTVGIFDLRMMGLVTGLSLSALHRLVPFGVFGFGRSVGSGLMFVTSSPDQYLYNRAFIVKVGCMLVAGLNVAFFYARVFARLQRTGADADPPLGARLAGGVSLTAWIGVMSAGRLLTFFRP